MYNIHERYAAHNTHSATLFKNIFQPATQQTDLSVAHILYLENRFSQVMSEALKLGKYKYGVKPKFKTANFKKQPN